MTGRLLVTSPIPHAPHTHARLNLASGRELRFVDSRRFGRLEFRDLRSDAPFHGHRALTRSSFVRASLPRFSTEGTCPSRLRCSTRRF